MNKKGFVGDGFVFGFMGIFILILILVSLIGIQDGNLSPKNIQETLSNTSNNVRQHFEINESNGVIINVVYSFCNFVVYSGIEVAKAGVSYGVSNPDIINPHTLIWIVIISLCIPIVWYGFLMIVSIFLIIKEWYLNRKEKKEINKIKQDKL